MKPTTFASLCVSLCVLCAESLAQGAAESFGDLDLNATFGGCGVEFKSPGKIEGLRLEWRMRDDRWWAIDPDAFPYFPKDGAYRGSICGLFEDTDYSVRIVAKDSIVAQGSFRTWKSDVPIAETVELSADGPLPIVISDKGTEDGWIRYVAKNGNTLDFGDRNKTPIVIRDARYVVIDGLRIIGNRARNVFDIRDARFIRIRNCDISRWGRTGEPRFDLRGRLFDPSLSAEGYGINFDGNLSFNKNEVTDLGGLPEITANAGMFSSEIGYDFKVTKGRPLGDVYGFINDGMYGINDFDYDATAGTWTLKEGIPDASGITGYAARPGSMKLKDVSGPNKTKDGVIDNNDITLLGNVQPLFTGGFSISSYWYNWDFAANFTYSYGNKVYNANLVDFSTIRGVAGQNVIAAMSPDNRWTNVDWTTGEFYTDLNKLAQANAGKTMWAPDNTRRVCQSYALEDASFLRLATITLGYTLPETLTKKLKMSKVRVYATANNVFCLTPYSGYDPEVDTRTATPLTPNVDYSAYPKSHSWVAGINITF